MKRLIIGGAGFIGSNLAFYLLQKGEAVSILDNLSRKGSLQNLQWLKEKSPKLEFINGDIRTDFELIKKAVEKADIVYHLAAQVAVTTSVTNPREDFETNAIGALNVLEAARLSRIPPILLYSSTNKVYGEMENEETIELDNSYDYKNLPRGVSESQPLDFHSPYGCSKGSADQYFHDYARIYSLKTIVFRQSCIYGPRQFGVEDQGWLAWFAIAASHNQPITIYGDGKQVRDVLYVKDLIQAYELSLDKIAVTAGQVYNVGGGRPFSISLLESLDYLEQLLGKKIELKFENWRPGDQKIFISDTAKAKKDFGWSAQTNPKEGIKILIDWVQNNKKLLESTLS